MFMVINELCFLLSARWGSKKGCVLVPFERFLIQVFVGAIDPSAACYIAKPFKYTVTFFD